MLIFLFLVLPIFVKAKWDDISFETNLTCSLQNLAWYKLQFWEYDYLLNSDDEITKLFEIQTSGGKSNQVFRGGQEGDASDDYQIYFKIQHNCSDDGTPKDAEAFLFETFPTGTDLYLRLRINLGTALDGKLENPTLMMGNNGLTYIYG